MWKESFHQQTNSIGPSSALKDSLCNQGQVHLQCVWERDAHRPLHSVEVNTTSWLFLCPSSSSSIYLLCVISSILLFHKLTFLWWSKHYLTFGNIPKVCVYHHIQSLSSAFNCASSPQELKLSVCVCRLKIGGWACCSRKTEVWLRAKNKSLEDQKNVNDAFLMIGGSTHRCCHKKISELQLWF